MNQTGTILSIEEFKILFRNKREFAYNLLDLIVAENVEFMNSDLENVKRHIFTVIKLMGLKVTLHK